MVQVGSAGASHHGDIPTSLNTALHVAETVPQAALPVSAAADSSQHAGLQASMLRRPGSAGGGGGAWKAMAAFAAGALVITVMNSLPGQNTPAPSSQPAAAPVSLRALSPQGSQLTAEHLSGIFVAPSASPRDVDSYGRGAASPRVVDSYARGAAPLAASAHLPEADPARQASVPASPPARDPLCGRGIFLDLGAHDGSSIP
eukprot:jgi/Tetstr1/437807/TSEL_026447.t1